MGNLTPLGLLASEPTKILMVRAKISTVTSIASVTIENAFYVVSGTDLCCCPARGCSCSGRMCRQGSNQICRSDCRRR